MNEDREGSGRADEVSELLRTLIEVSVSQNELIAALSRKVDTAICILERISEHTCETLNEVHEQTTLQAALAERAETCVTCHREIPEKHPASHCEPPAPCDTGPRERYCTYEPCEPAEEEGGSAVSLPGSAPPQRAFGAPFPPAVSTDDPEDDANEFPAPEVPRGPFRGFLVPGQTVRPLDISSGDTGDDPDPVIFGKYTNYGKVATPFRRSPRISAGRRAAASYWRRETSTPHILPTGELPLRPSTRRLSSTTRRTAVSAVTRSCSTPRALTGLSG